MRLYYVDSRGEPAKSSGRATRSAAEYLHQTEMGVIAKGMRADLVLLDRNPLESVENLAHPAGVMVRGKWLPRIELDRRLGEHGRAVSGGATGQRPGA